MVAVVVSPVLAPDPMEQLAARLDDPIVADAMQQLLDHVDLIALLVSGLDGFIRRSDDIIETVAEGVAEIKSIQKPEGLPTVDDVVGLIRSLSGLMGPLQEMMPVVQRLMTSDVINDQVVDVSVAVSRAVARTTQSGANTDIQIKGIRSIFKALKDDDVNRTLGFVLSIAKAVGQELDHLDPARPRPY